MSESGAPGHPRRRRRVPFPPLLRGFRYSEGWISLLWEPSLLRTAIKLRSSDFPFSVREIYSKDSAALGSRGFNLQKAKGSKMNLNCVGVHFVD